jgi:FGGY family of carbohydrate kinases, C-terminal domain
VTASPRRAQRTPEAGDPKSVARLHLVAAVDERPQPFLRDRQVHDVRGPSHLPRAGGRGQGAGDLPRAIRLAERGGFELGALAPDDDVELDTGWALQDPDDYVRSLQGGGRIPSEWFFAKALQILDEAPEAYARAERLIETCDWIVWKLTGVEIRMRRRLPAAASSSSSRRRRARSGNRAPRRTRMRETPRAWTASPWGMCGVVDDGIVPGYFGYEAGQVGMTLATRAPDIYRALVEATAIGTRVIVEAFERAGLPVGAIVACGCLPDRNPFAMQVFADVTGREIAVAGSRQAPALGAAMFGAVAAGEHDQIEAAAAPAPA